MMMMLFDNTWGGLIHDVVLYMRFEAISESRDSTITPCHVTLP